jgi:hypothetical protein
MTKDYRSRRYGTTYQVAVPDASGNPARNPDGSIKLDHGGLRFFKVAGHDHQENKRLLACVVDDFFNQKAKELKAQLQAEGIGPNDVDERGLKILDQVTAEAVIEEYATMFTRPNGTYLPRDAEGRPMPSQFTLIVPRALCVNPAGAGGLGTNVNGAPKSQVPPSQSLALFQRLRASTLQRKPAPAPKGKPAA